MNKKIRVYRTLAAVLCMILIIAACTPINTQSNHQESPTSTLAEITPTVIDTKTSTPTQEATETNTPTPTEVPEKYPIDIEKLHNFPESYEYMVDNLDEFVEAPDGFTDPEALYNWWTDKCIPALGNQEDLEPNVFAEVGSRPDGFYLSMPKNYSQPLLSEPSTFYFRHEDRVYPVIVLTVKTFDDINNGTFAIVLHDQSQNGDDGFAAIKRMYEGKKIGTLYGQTDNVLGGDSNQHIQLFLHSDYNWKDFICEGHTCTWSNMEPGMLVKDRPNKYAIGLGAIGTYDD